MCHPNGLLFHQKSSDKDPILVKKSLEEGPISQNVETNWKISCFGVENPLEMGPEFEKKLEKQSNQPFFEGEKSLDKGKGFRPRTTHPIKK